MTNALLLIPQKTKSPKRLKSTPKQRKKQRIQNTTHKSALVTAIKSTEQDLKIAHNRFNEVTDPDLIESLIFQISSLQSQHNYLTRQLRE